MKTDEINALVTPTAVHKSVYTDQAIFDLEIERIFGKTWLYVAHESQLRQAGDFVRARIGLQDFIVTRDESGEIHVVQNRCTHRGATLCHENQGNTKRFVCGYHQWMFDLSGTLRGVPHKQSYPESFNLNAQELALKKAPRVSTYRGFVFASLSATGPDLVSFLGPMCGAIDNLVDRSPVGEIELAPTAFRLQYRGNWKMHHENANDTIHPGVVHNSSVQTARQHNAQNTEFDAGQTREMLQGNGFSKNEWEGIELAALPGGHSYMDGIYRNGLLARKEVDPVRDRYEAAMIQAYGEERTRAILDLDRFNNLIYPNININAQYHQLRVVHPVAPDLTLVTSYCFKLVGAPDAIFHRAVRFLTNLGSPASMIYGDDATIFERCNQGLRNADNDVWINMQRGMDYEKPLPHGGTIDAATEAPIRSQFQAWLDYMTTEEQS
tara:strand:- start:2181 stop:3494 length:1314 start_codon:yes stop_codon:yes gene_type:complete